MRPIFQNTQKDSAMKKNNFLINTIILSLASLFLNILGIVFKIYLVSQMGEEGMGVYQLILSIYSFGATIAASGLSFTVTRLISEEIATRNEFRIPNMMKKSFQIACIFGFSAFSLLFFAGNFIAENFLGNTEIVPCLKILAFGLPFMAMSSCINGFFMGLRKVSDAVVIQIFEDVTQAAITIAALTFFIQEKSTPKVCTAIVAGTALGEVLAFLYAYTKYRREISKFSAEKKFPMAHIVKITLPISVTSYIKSALVSAENLMIPISLQLYGYTQTQSLELLGLVKGMVLPLLFFPSVVLSAFSRMLMPEFADSNAIGDKSRIDQTGSAVISLSLAFGILVFGIFFFFADEIGVLIYSSESAGEIIRLICPIVPMMYLDGIIDGMLKGLNQQVSVMKYSIFEAIIRVGIVWFAIPIWGKWGFIGAIYCGNIVNAAMSLAKFIRSEQIKYPIFKKILIFSCMIVLTALPFSLLAKKSPPSVFTWVLIVCPTGIYCLLLFLFGVLPKSEKQVLKMLFTGKKASG